jgi:hypothetical protein
MNSIALNLATATISLYGITLKFRTNNPKIFLSILLSFLLQVLNWIVMTYHDCHETNKIDKIGHRSWKQSLRIIIFNYAITTKQLVYQSKQHPIRNNLKGCKKNHVGWRYKQCCSNNLSTGCIRTACSQLVDKMSTAG